MRKKNRPIVFWKEPLVPVYLGDVVVCDAYITKSKSYFAPNYKKGVLELRDGNNKLIEEIESGSTGEFYQDTLLKSHLARFAAYASALQIRIQPDMQY